MRAQCNYLGVQPYWRPILCDTRGIIVAPSIGFDASSTQGIWHFLDFHPLSGWPNFEGVWKGSVWGFFTRGSSLKVARSARAVQGFHHIPPNPHPTHPSLEVLTQGRGGRRSGATSWRASDDKAPGC